MIPIEKQKLRTLLIQIRDNAQVRAEEHRSFCEFSGLEASQIDIFNVFDQPHFTPDICNGYHAVFVGGASEANVLEKERFPFVDNSIELMRYCIEQGIPVFASCFGFQLAVLALEGEITTDEHNFEMGTLPICLTDSAEKDPVFAGVPNPFMAVAVHRQKAENTPAGCIELANTAVCSHAFKVKGKPFWAFQFHPEVNRKILVERLTVFKKQYTDGDDHLNSVLENAVETPYSNQLLKNFVDRVLCGSAKPALE